MLCYWILRRPDGTPAGLVRVQNDRVLLKPTAPIAGTFTLFSDTEAVPILPENETVLPRAAALLGTENGEPTCFAAAPDAKPLAHYRRMLSQFHTNTEASPEPVAAQAPDSPDISQNSTMSVEISEDIPEYPDIISQNSTIISDSIDDTAREAQAFSALLQHADAFYAAYETDPSVQSVDNMVQKEDKMEERGIDLFAQEYPGARWRYVDGTDVLAHYEGTWRQPNGQMLHILAVRGRAAPRPPRALYGFTRFLRDRDGTGYWLRLTPLP